MDTINAFLEALAVGLELLVDATSLFTGSAELSSEMGSIGQDTNTRN